ncbi:MULTISPECIES: ABC transporter permease [Sodalis]|uniref:NitT/TauT family transport system permease protein n=1 Tax=Sodalis ligni TaxID=2697027 RepID=A0A4R1NCN4_9GAMM|nr:ABC transporter permease subunit [Sodalis ligni]TCL05162.1 NitT/TauT family transport system permease protein [Sodalis ligni]
MAAREVPAPPPAGTKVIGRGAGRAAAGLIRMIWPYCLIILLWQCWLVLDDVPALIAPSPLQTLAGTVTGFAQYLPDLLTTLMVIGTGLGLGMLLGITVASLSWFSPMLSGVLTPLTILLNTLPSIALIPIVASIFGYTLYTIIVIAALISYFPAFVLTRSGLDSIPPGAADLLHVLGAGKRRHYLHVALPAAVPNIITALRISAMLSVVGALTAEWLLGTRGLGYRLAKAQQIMDTDQAWQVSLIGVVLSLVIFGIASGLERKVSMKFR